MNEILNIPVSEMAGVDFDCSCGRHHTFHIDRICMGKGVLPELVEIAKPFRDKPILILSDNHTFNAAGKRVLRLLDEAGYDVNSHVFQTEDSTLIPDESVVGRAMMELRPHTGLIVAVGSGSLNDTAKFISSRTGIPYVIVCTAPSMDGYLSSGAPLITAGRKISYIGTFAYAVVGDTDIMKEAPMSLIQAGFGDCLGKFTALADWCLSREIAGEHYCETCVTLVKRALDKVIENADGIAKRDDEAILSLIEALNLTGVTMALVGYSRPASGAEHLLSHYWEMESIAQKRDPALHGLQVGVATPVIAEIYDMMRDEIPEEALEFVPSREYCEDMLRRAGAPVYPNEIGIDRKLFYNSIIDAYAVRERYSILKFAVDKGRIEDIAEKLTNRIYGPEA